MSHPADAYLSKVHVDLSSELAVRIRAGNPEGVPEGCMPKCSRDDELAIINCVQAHDNAPLWTMENLDAWREFCVHGVTKKAMPPRKEPAGDAELKAENERPRVETRTINQFVLQPNHEVSAVGDVFTIKPRPVDGERAAVIRLLSKISEEAHWLKHTEAFEAVCAIYGVYHDAQRGLVSRNAA